MKTINEYLDLKIILPILLFIALLALLFLNDESFAKQFFASTIAVIC